MNANAVVSQVTSLVSQHPLLARLLVASLELIVVTGVVLAIIHIGRVRSNRVVSLLWLIALTKPLLTLALGTAAPIYNIAALAPESATTTAALETVTEISNTSGSVVRSGAATIAAAVGTASAAAVRAATDPARAITGAWLLGAAIMALLSIADRLRIRRLVAGASTPPDEIVELYRRAAGPNTDRRLPRLLITDRLESPAIAGTFLPVVFLPAWMTRNVDAERVYWALRHELTHWHRRDHLAGFVGEISRIVFFFHPLVWWVGRGWKVATEMACDEAMVATRNDARLYAEQLYQILTRVHTRRRIMLANGLFATRTQIGKRIELLLKSHPKGTRRKLPAAVFIALFAALVFALGAEIAPVAKDKKVTIETKGEDDGIRTVSVVEDDGKALTLVIKGDIEFDEDKTDIISISKGGSFKIAQDDDGVERELEVKPGKDGKLEWIYEVDGKNHEFDDEARAWFSDVVKDVYFDGEDGDFLIVTKPHIKLVKPIVIKEGKGQRAVIRIGDSSNLIHVYEFDDGDKKRRTIQMSISDDDDNSEVWISTEGDITREDGDHVKISITPKGKILVVVKKDGDKHELEVNPKDGRDPEYIYKLNGDVKPYGDEEKKIFEKYLKRLESGFEMYPGEKL